MLGERGPAQDPDRAQGTVPGEVPPPPALSGATLPPPPEQRRLPPKKYPGSGRLYPREVMAEAFSAKARFPALEVFDFSFQPSLPVTLIKELARLDFLGRGKYRDGGASGHWEAPSVNRPGPQGL